MSLRNAQHKVLSGWETYQRSEADGPEVLIANLQHTVKSRHLIGRRERNKLTNQSDKLHQLVEDKVISNFWPVMMVLNKQTSRGDWSQHREALNTRVDQNTQWSSIKHEIISGCHVCFYLSEQFVQLSDDVRRRRLWTRHDRIIITPPARLSSSSSSSGPEAHQSHLQQHLAAVDAHGIHGAEGHEGDGDRWRRVHRVIVTEQHRR